MHPIRVLRMMKHTIGTNFFFFLARRRFIPAGKNLQVGYTVPRKGIISKMHIENLRIYFSGENLWTFTDFFSSYDPEIPVSSGGYYPITASYSLGLSITFK